MMIFSCFTFLSTVTNPLSRISSLAFFILCSCGCGWMTRTLCISHTCMAILKHFHPLIHNSMRHSIAPILSTHALQNLSTYYTFSPWEMYHRSLLLLGAILKFCCHVHYFVATLTLIARLTGLPSQLVT
jgi:hypothetical protein